MPSATPPSGVWSRLMLLLLCFSGGAGGGRRFPERAFCSMALPCPGLPPIRQRACDMTIYAVFDRDAKEVPAVVAERFSWLAFLLPPLFAPAWAAAGAARLAGRRAA